MADVFISYSPLDHARVRPIAERLTSLGYNVLWDQEQRARLAARGQLERALDAAAVVLTIWTQHARNAAAVYAQSARALDGEKLLQLRLDKINAPAPFNALNVADMSGDRPEWGPLEDALQRLASGGPAPDPETPIKAPGLFATPALTGASKLLTLACLLTLLGYAGAVSAAYAGAMNLEQLRIAMWGVIGAGGVCAVLAAARLFVMRRAGS